MTISLYDITVPPLLQGLKTLAHYLDKAEAFSADKQLAATELIEARLAPDMLNFAGQIQRCSDSAKGSLARLTGQEMPSFADTEATFAELRERIAKTVALLNAADPAAINAGIDRQIELKFRTATGVFSGKDYVIKFMLPNFYFHVTTAHDILRHQGVDVGKGDYLGLTG